MTHPTIPHLAHLKRDNVERITKLAEKRLPPEGASAGVHTPPLLTTPAYQRANAVLQARLDELSDEQLVELTALMWFNRGNAFALDARDNWRALLAHAGRVATRKDIGYGT